MSAEPEYETQSIDHLGIFAGISREMGLVEAIDEKIGQTGRKVSCGEAVLAMILNILGFSSRALWRYVKSCVKVRQSVPCLERKCA